MKEETKKIENLIWSYKGYQHHKVCLNMSVWWEPRAYKSLRPA